MTNGDLIKETYVALTINKIRSGLTVLGIVIGISSVIIMVAIGQGAQNTVTERIQSIGSNLVMITPGAQRGPGTMVSSGARSAQSLTVDDAKAIEKEIGSIEALAPDTSSRYQVVAKGTNTNTSVVGTTSAYPQVRNVEMAEGDFISDQNNDSWSKVAVLGPSARDDLFGEGAEAIGEKIKIKGIQFKVIGVTKSKGSSGASNQDDTIYVPLTTSQKFLSGSDNLSTISIQAVDEDSMTELQAEVTSLLMSRHNISDSTKADFRVMNQSDIVATASSVTETFTILLAAVAGISLVVGGIGIMNMMLTTVTERTREIGLRKAVGAKRADINKQFLAEATMLTFIGGTAGIILGWLGSWLMSATGIIEADVSLFSIVLAFGVSAVIGIVFGYYPARRAASLSPIAALRYE